MRVASGQIDEGKSAREYVCKARIRPLGSISPAPAPRRMVADKNQVTSISTQGRADATRWVIGASTPSHGGVQIEGSIQSVVSWHRSGGCSEALCVR